MTPMFGRRRRDAAEPATAPATGPLPMPPTRERLAAHLRSQAYSFGTDADGDLAARWDGNPFWLMLLGDREEVLQVRGRWASAVPLTSRTTALHLVNDWNRDRYWPKAYVREEQGALSLYGECSTDLESGVTDGQLGELVEQALETTLSLFAVAEASLGPVAIRPERPEPQAGPPASEQPED